jgi:pimeloyl-ACP methyl ester carboxylesterase
VSDSAFARFDSAVEGRMVSAFGPVVGNVLHPQARKHGERFLGIPAHTIAPEEALPQIAPRPVLLIQGGRDRLVVPENAQRLLAVAPGNAELWEVPEAAHVASVYARSQEYAQKVVAFYQEALQQLLQGNKPTAFQNKRELS